ncbi:MAG: hypothetical protein AAB270_07070 [Chloroflexota bacterium]|mgnify:FL=1
MMRKTRLMRRVEDRYHRPLEKLLPEMYNEMGLPLMAEEMGVSRSTIWYWLLRYGVNLRRVALAAGETLEIKKVR